MNELSTRNKEEVLKILIDLSRKGIDNIICKPVNFEDNFKFISVESLIEMLKILEDEGLIDVVYADYPKHFNIYTLQITPKGLFYLPQKNHETKQKWFDRLLGWFSGHLFVFILLLLL